MILKQPAFQAYKGIHIAGVAGKRFDIELRNGRFVLVVEAGPDREGLDAPNAPVVQYSAGQDALNRDQELWISPGIIDLHTHLAWTDFDHEDQLARDSREVEKMQAEALAATLRTGVTTARDAGGLPPVTIRHLVQHYQQPLRVETSSAMLGAADAKGTRHLEKRLAEVYATGAAWVKIMATGGLGAETEKVTEPNFSQEEFAFIVRHAHKHGKKVLVHSWGGVTIDWSAQAGVASIEHGMFLTRDQAGRLAEAGVAYVPTASIYRIAADPKGVLGLPPVICERAARAADAHAAAIGYAREAGVRLGFGTDYATPALHGYNLQELDTLIGYGLSRAEVWQSATQDAAVILGRGHELGRIAEGYLADAVIYTADPYQARNAEELRASIAAVITAAQETDLI